MKVITSSQRKNDTQMKSSVVIFLILLVVIAFYFLGKKSGADNVKVSMVENVDMVKQIAELAALDVTGSLNMKVSNKGEGAGTWEKFKNYFAENTLQVSVPYEAKYGVQMSDQKMNIDTKAGTVLIYLPRCKLMSLQLKLDKMETMAQSGLFVHATIDDLVKAQKQLYGEALIKLQNDPNFLQLAEEHIASILSNYYKPLGYKVKCVFEEKPAVIPVQ